MTFLVGYSSERVAGFVNVIGLGGMRMPRVPLIPPGFTVGAAFVAPGLSTSSTHVA